MPTFDTPEPISVTVSLLAGDIRVSASDRTDTVVEVRPVRDSSKADVKMAEQTRVEYADGRLLVKTPKQLGSLFGRTGTIDVVIKVPSDSHLRADTGMGELRCEGRLGDCHGKTGMGHISVDQTRVLYLNTGTGEVTVQRADGDTHASTGTGPLRIGQITGTAAIKNSNGTTWIGEVTADAVIKSANGDITVDRAHAGVTAKTAAGTVRVGEVSRGSVVLETATGAIEVGIRRGTAAWLDVNTGAGRVRNMLETTGSPDSSEETVEIRAHTYHGDIIIRRS